VTIWRDGQTTIWRDGQTTILKTAQMMILQAQAGGLKRFYSLMMLAVLGCTHRMQACNPYHSTQSGFHCLVVSVIANIIWSCNTHHLICQLAWIFTTTIKNHLPSIARTALPRRALGVGISRSLVITAWDLHNGFCNHTSGHSQENRSDFK
jgi:hypothetical protein